MLRLEEGHWATCLPKVINDPCIIDLGAQVTLNKQPFCLYFMYSNLFKLKHGPLSNVIRVSGVPKAIWPGRDTR